MYDRNEPHHYEEMKPFLFKIKLSNEVLQKNEREERGRIGKGGRMGERRKWPSLSPRKIPLFQHFREIMRKKKEERERKRGRDGN